VSSDTAGDERARAPFRRCVCDRVSEPEIAVDAGDDRQLRQHEEYPGPEEPGDHRPEFEVS